MRSIVLLSALTLTVGCLQTEPVDTPDRAVRSFNGSTVTIQSKSPTVDADDIALAKSVCPGAAYQTTNFVIDGVSEYLFICK